MRLGRVIGSAAAAAAVAGCVVAAVHLSQPSSTPSPAAGTHAPLTTVARSIPAVPPAQSESPAIADPPSTPAGATPDRTTTHPAPSTSARSATASRATASVSPAHRSATPHPSSSTPKPRTTTAATTPPAKPTTSTAARGSSLPLGYSTGSATRVLTVTASSRGSTVARLQAWSKAPGGGWLRYGSAVTAHLGSDGMSSSPSESKSATPMGSFTLTQAFGRLSNPGTKLPYFRTTPADWWISQSGPLYNTHQRCSSHCAFAQGNPNEHLYYETPYYNYAVVIDYNTRNAPGGVRQGAGSAFFLHVTDGGPTAGCVSIPQSTLVTLMRWLTPSSHPRILIGTT